MTADGIAVGAKNVGQDFTEDYFMWCRPSAYNYNTYYEEDTDGDGQVDQWAFSMVGSRNNSGEQRFVLFSKSFGADEIYEKRENGPRTSERSSLRRA
mgnify:CR=1 FL=1